MATFEANIPEGLRRFLAGEGLGAAISRAVLKTAIDARDLLAEATPKDTGDTARRWQVTKTPTPQDPTAVVSNDSQVMIFLEYGTGIYSDHPNASRQVIRPKNARALGPVEWMGESDVYFAWVRGMRPTFTVRRLLPRIRQMLIENAESEIRRLFSG